MMVNRVRALIIGAGALGAASVAGVALLSDESAPNENRSAAAGGSAAEFEICLRRDIGFAQADGSQCFNKAALEKFWTLPLVSARGDPTVVELTHPTDMSVPPAECITCSEYEEKRGEGWYALSSKEIRREGYFIRACGALKMLSEARPAKARYFPEGGLTGEDISSLKLDATLSPEKAPENEEMRIERSGDSEWRLISSSQIITFQEIANADFNNDGVEDIMVFLYVRPRGGTASLSELALLEKTAETAPIILTRALSGA